MDVFWADVEEKFPKNIDELKEVIAGGNYYAIGKSHSYNGVQVIDYSRSIMFSKVDFGPPKYDAGSECVTVGPSTTIEQLKVFLRDKKRRLVNSGNYMAQTVIGALMTGTHGFGPGAVMADSICALKFLDSKGDLHELKRGDPDFKYAALSFGLIAPIVSITLETKPLANFESNIIVCRRSERDQKIGKAEYVSYAVLPYSDKEDPTMVIHALTEAPDDAEIKPKKYRFLSLKWLAEFLLRQMWAFDRMFPFFRPSVQMFIHRMALEVHQKRTTEKGDLDFLYDPHPLTARERTPHLARGMFSTTKTAYNLAFFVEEALVDEVIRNIMDEADKLRTLGFYLKSTIGVRMLPGKSDLPFAGNFNGPVAAIDVFSDTRDYAWLERIQNEIMQFYQGRVRPHWGKSAIVMDFEKALTTQHISKMKALHMKHFPYETLMINPRVKRLFGFETHAPGTESERQEQIKRGIYS